MTVILSMFSSLPAKPKIVTSMSARRIPPQMFLSITRGFDLFILLTIAFVVFIKDTQPTLGLPSQRATLLVLLAAATMTWGVLHSGGAYRSVQIPSKIQYRCVVTAILTGTTVLWGLLKFIALDAGQERPVLLAWVAGSAAAVAVARGASTLLAEYLTTKGRLSHRIAIYGAGEDARSIVRGLRGNAISGVHVVGIYEEGRAPAWVAADDLAFRGGLLEIMSDVRGAALDAVVIGVPAKPDFDVCHLLEGIKGCVVDVYRLYNPIAGADLPVDYIGLMPVTSVAKRPLSEWQVFQKALFDRIGAALLLLILLPAFAVISLLIRLDSSGPVLFRQPRIGFNNSVFTCLKFRTMQHDMRDLLGGQQTSRKDPRVTSVGYWLRRLSLDELPQLLNVLRGEMSLVGPRPHPLNTHIEGKPFADLLPHYADRHRVTPGITGWAQVKGWRGAATTAHHLEQRVLHDIYYIENWSLLFDAYILFLTLFRGFMGPQAY